MAKYVIHACNKREDYVYQYLLPSLLKQGISRENIHVYVDRAKQGNLRAFMASSEMIEDDMLGTWHLQDDVIVSSDFRIITEEFNSGIVCGFCNQYSEDLPIGLRPIRDMWYSFPCIRIPNHILKSFIEWLNSRETQNRYRAYIDANKFDDTLFRAYVLERHKNIMVLNLYPNIVDNVDYLLGGSLVNRTRGNVNVNSLYFKDKYLIEDLKNVLSKI